jgi:glycosyltransferase involved in cell wall biosynthesis
VSAVVNIVSPMPPKPNGIADYCHALAESLLPLTPLRIVADDPFARTPGALTVHDPEQAHRYAGPDDIFNYHIGNNPDHGFVLELLLRRRGVVTLHDLNLLYLYETIGASQKTIFELMMRSNPGAGAVWALHQKLRLGGDRTRHGLFDLQGEILDHALAIVVHSRFARELIRLKHGEAAAAKVRVIPHFAPDASRYHREKCRAALGLARDEVIVLTSGFATKAKRFDWIVAALDDVLREGRRFRWIHAGQERPGEFPLTETIQRHPALWACSVVTGYLCESELDLRIGAADILINLRFPSVGESSGTLARAYAAGACCIVSDTAGYAEIPRDCVAHVPAFDVRAHLARTLARLIDAPDLRRTMGARARRFATTELSRGAVAKAYLGVFEASRAAPPPRPAPERPAPGARRVDLADDIDGNLREIDAALRTMTRDGSLVIGYANACQLQQTFSRLPLDERLARRGFSIGDVNVVQSGREGGEIVVAVKAGL